MILKNIKYAMYVKRKRKFLTFIELNIIKIKLGIAARNALVRNWENQLNVIHYSSLSKQFTTKIHKRIIQNKENLC